MRLNIGIGKDDSWKDPLNLYGGKAPSLDSAPSAPAPAADTPKFTFNDQDRADLVNTVIAEAAGEGPEGMIGVASVIKNRAAIRGLSPGDVVREPDQFTGYFAPGRDARRAQQDPTARKAAEEALDSVFSGAVADPTNGADHYHADYVSPYWAPKMEKTGQIGRHLYYRSGAKIDAGKEQQLGFAPGLDGKFQDPFQAVLNPQPETAKNTPGISDGQAGQALDASPLFGKLQSGKPRSYIENMKPELQQGLTGLFNDAPDFVKSGLDIMSGARSPERQAQIIAENAGKYGIDRKAWLADVQELGPVDAGKKWRPIFRESGMSRWIGAPGGSRHQHGDAADLGWQGGSLKNAPKEVVDWLHTNAANYGLAFPLANENWHIETAGARGGHQDESPAGAKIAPGLQALGFVDEAKGGNVALENVKMSAAPENGIVADRSFQAKDPMGLYSGANPIQTMISDQFATMDQRQAEASAQAEQNRMNAATESENARISRQQQALEADRPGRYVEMNESDLPGYQQQWEAENRSSGVVNDVGKMLASGNARLGLSVREAVNMIPVAGPKVVSALDSIDEWVTGKPTAQRLRDYADYADSSVTQQQQEADSKKWLTTTDWVDPETGEKRQTISFGPAWSDPRSYLGMTVRSAPETAVSMLPAMRMARGVYLTRVAAGMGEAQAAAAAARVATVAGGITEGVLGGADAAVSVEEQIAAMPPEALRETDSFKALVAGGMDEKEAVAAITKDAKTQAFILAGVANAAFGGMGDRMLAKIISEGVEGGVARRVATGLARGVVSEGIFEEAPQSAGQQIAENVAMQSVDPKRGTFDDVAEQAVGGLVGGSVMGGAMGAGGGLVRPARGGGADSAVEQDGVDPQGIPGGDKPSGPIARSVQHAETRIADRSAPGEFPVGTTVVVKPDGMPEFMSTVQGTDGAEVLISDPSTGELLQVPREIVQPTVSPSGQDLTGRSEERIPDITSDPAFKPSEPIAGDVSTEPLPEPKDQQRAMERPQGRPKPGARVIVDDPAGGRFAATLERYEVDGAEALLKTDEGKPVQVPVDRIFVDKLTAKQIEKQDLERNPPIEREPADAGPNSRRVFDNTVVLPDEDHAHLYDFAKSRLLARKLGGAAFTDLEKVDGGEQARLAARFKVSREALISMADDYRYRVDNAAKNANGKLPIKFNAVDQRRLKQWQNQFAKQEGNSSPDADSMAHWYDIELTAAERARILEQAGVKRSDRAMWGSHTPSIQKKIEAARFGNANPAPAAPVAESPVTSGEQVSLDVAAHEAATSPTNALPQPTQAQKEAGNYKVGKIKLGGMDISIENPAGSERKGTDADGKPWSVKMRSHYGYIRGTVGRDKDHIDVFVRPGTDAVDDSSPAFVVDQRSADGKFDEHKVLIGFDSEDAARRAYLENYTKGWRGLGDISQTTVGEFKAWTKNGDTRKPFAPKWYSTEEKARSYIAKNKLDGTHDVVQAGKRFEIREKSPEAKEAQASSPEPILNAKDHAWSDLWNSEWDAVSDGLSNLASVNGGDQWIVDMIRAGATNKELLTETERRWGQGGTGGNRYMVETGAGPVVKFTFEQTGGNKKLVLRGKELADALRKEFKQSLDEMKAEHAAREKAAEQAKPQQTPQAAPAAKKMRAKATPLLDRLENYFRPGRVVPAYSGQDRIISFERREAGGFSVSVQAVDKTGKTLPMPDGRTRVHSTAPSERELAAWEKENPVAAAQKAPATKVRTPDPSPSAVSAAPAVSANTIFTEDAADKARELLRKKLGTQLNSGIDPEIMQAGITLAGYHIEKGARTFAAYAKAMLSDLGETARPYLKSWYMGVKYDPRAAAFDGMSSARDVDEYDVASINGDQNDEPSELDQPGTGSLEGTSADPVPGAEGSGRVGTSVEGRGQSDLFGNGRTGEGRVSSGRGVPNGSGAVSVPAGGRGLSSAGNEPDARNGEGSSQRTENDGREVEEGPFGPILRGYEGNWRAAALELERMQTGDAVGALHHPDVGAIDLVWGKEGTGKSDGYGLSKLIAWHPEALNDLQGLIDRMEVVTRSENRINLRSAEGDHAGVRLDWDGRRKTWLISAYEVDKRRSERSTDRLADIWKDVSSFPPPDTKVAKNAVDVDTAATPAQKRAADFTITAEDEIGAGGQKSKFNGNVAAIRLLRTLDQEKRSANREEQAILAKWVGWGGLRNAFFREDGSTAKGWEKQAAELKGLLTPEEYSAAESSTRNAHYTSMEVVNAVWSAVRQLGFTGGQMLEPSVGAGNFIGLMPADLKQGARVTGVELDRVTGSIARNLYPAANIQAPMGFEKLDVPDGHFDLAIGNPPFGSEKVYDKKRRHLNKLSIHNFFFAKSVEALRPGGVLAMVVTNRFLDGSNASARELIAKSSDLVAAIRLPNNAFLKNAGTEVTTDIVILRKRMPGEAPSATKWTEIGVWKGSDGKAVPLNQFFIQNPDKMLGDFGAFGSMYGPDEPALVARAGDDINTLLSKAVASLPKDIMVAPGEVKAEAVAVPETVTDVQVGSLFTAPDGTIHVRLSDSIGQPHSQPVEFPNESAPERVAGMIRVRDAFAKLRRAQIDESAPDSQVENLRKRLNVVYDAFVAKHGPINRDVNKRLFRDDPTWPQISALESEFDKGLTAKTAKNTGEAPREPSAKKAAIFAKRTQQPYRAPSSASSAKDALATTLNERGRVDLAMMARLYGKPEAEIIEELGSLLFKSPDGRYETSDAYLSGNVKQKLAEAERAAESDPDFRRNVAALKDVIPADIEAIDIDVKAGAPWVPVRHVEDFLHHIAQSAAKPQAYYSAANAKWVLTVPHASAAAGTQWGTDRADVPAVLSAALNGQTITISDRMRDGSSVVDQAATDAANEKVERVKAEWRRWVWDDDQRRGEIARLYNDVFNTDVMRAFDGSHLTLPGKVGDDIIAFRPHQKNFVWRTLQSGTTLADHTVGAGKTFAAIASAMEKRRIGQARKPMFVVPNHLVGQWAADFLRLYPGANVLAATKDDFKAGRRKRLFARVATGDWDAVIVAHSSFGMIGMDPEYEARFIQQQMEDLETSITDLRRATGEKSRNVNQLTKWRDSLKAKLERLLDAGRKDDGLTFDELGVDALYVDEAHEFKNLAFATSMTRVAGLGNQKGSQKAADLYMKSRFILEKTGGNNVQFLTGTPLSNTMAEMYTMQRYLDEKALKALGLAHFDAWARVFGEVVTDWELSPSGKYKLNSRFAKFVNMPELMQRYRSFADVVSNDDIKAQLASIGKTLPLPKVKGGKPQNIAVERSSDQADFIGVGKVDDSGELVFPKGSLVFRAENLPKKAEKGADNMLKVMSDARKAALDMRLIDPAYSDHPGSKVHVAADNIKRIYDAWDADKGTQLVFIDLSTPKKAKAAEEARIRELMQKAEDGDEEAQSKLDEMSPDEFLALQSSFSVYDDLRDKLIQRGVPAGEIAFIHDANTELQKEELFGKVRSGRIRVLFGSTPKMGAGTNVQNRLVALHHLDAPWRPSDLEQRDGRGIRQGNEMYGKDPDGFEIEILRYATKNTLDARQWQGIEAKATFIQQVRKGDLKTRVIDDIAGEAANAAEMKAEASGNPLILEEMETRRKLKQLQGAATEHEREQHRIKSRIKALDAEVAELEARTESVTKDAESAAAMADAPFAAQIGGVSYDKPKEFGAAIIAAMRKELIDKTGEQSLGTVGSFALSMENTHSRQFELTISGARDYHVHVENAADVDPTGLAMRVVNTIKKLPSLPAADRARIGDARSQVPALEKQIGNWANAQDLEDTAARHRRILDALKPQPKSAPSAAPGATIVVENKRADPAAKGDGRMKSLPVPNRPSNEAHADWAQRVVMERGKATGHEYLIAIDEDGSVVEYGTSGETNYTGMSDRLAAAQSNPDRRLVIYHNHPSNLPLSAPDVAALVYGGIHAVYSVGHDGLNSRGAMTPGARDAIAGSVRSYTALAEVMVRKMSVLQTGAEAFLSNLMTAKKITYSEAANALNHFPGLVAQKAGIIDFSTSVPYDAATVPGYDQFIAQQAPILAGVIYGNGKPATNSSGTGRPAVAVRHIADVAAMAGSGQKVADDKSVSTGLSEGSPRGNRAEAAGSRQRGEKRVSENRIVREIDGKLIDLQPAVLKTIPLNYFTELARPNMSAVGDYLRVKRMMDAYRGTKHASADAIAGEWLKYSRLGFMGKDKAKAQELADLMHESTIAGVDPSKVDAETAARPGYGALRKRFMALPPNGRQLFAKVRDAYKAQAEELDNILLDNVRKAQQIAHDRAEDRYRRTLDRIRDSGLKGIDLRKAEEDAASSYKAETTKATWAAKARMTKLRIAFESSRVQEPYFPLGRFGRYFVAVRDIDGELLSFSKFEKAADRDKAAVDMERQFPTAKVERGVMEAGADLRKAMDPRVVAEIEEILGGAGVGEEVMDQIWQRYLESMPDLSLRKRHIHRKGTAGYYHDALRVFSSHMFHAAHQTARLKYGMELQELVSQAMDQAKESDDTTRGVTLANELASRHNWVMNPTGSKVAQVMTSTAFVWFLAASPAAAAVNMTQTVMMGLPILAARFGGMAKATAALGRASLDTVKGRGSIARGSLSKDEKAAIEAFYESGLIDRTQSHDIAGVGETGVEYSPLRARVMAVISWAFHRAEVWNREVTALAAYRMARDAGQSAGAAIDTAHELTWKTHFDYANSSRPTVLQNDVAKVALVFRQHNINMLYRLFRDIHQSIKGETQQARKEARFQLAGVMGMMGLMAGVTGMAGFHLAMALASMIFGDDDDPMAFEESFKANVIDVLGPELGGIVLNGAPGHYLGVDLSSRIGMPDLWFRSPSRDLQGKDEYQYWLSQTLGATAGLGETMFTGASLILDGDYARGIETMAPKAVRDLMKAYRYGSEGLTTIGGDEVMSADQMSGHDMLAQAMGFSPAAVAETWDRNTALKNAERTVLQKRQRLVNKFAIAAMAGDDAGIDEALTAIEHFNSLPIHAGVAIKQETLRRSIKTRARNSAEREDGVLIKNKVLGTRLRELLSDRVYD